MWPLKNRFQKLKREEVIDSVIQLEKQEEALEAEILRKDVQIDELMKKGRTEKSRDVRLLYARKVNNLKEGKQDDVKRCMYLLYNIRLMERLRTSMNDESFFADARKVSLGDLLADQKGLAKFLNRALNTKIAAEDVLTNADDTFNEVESLYEQNDKIYKSQKSDDDLLVMFEEQDQTEFEAKFSGLEAANLDDVTQSPDKLSE